MRITSPHNPNVRFMRSLARPAFRHEQGAYLAEGVRLVREAMQTAQPARMVFYEPGLLERTPEGSDLLDGLPGWCEQTYEVNQRVLDLVSETETPSGVVAALDFPPEQPLETHRGARLGLVLDGLGDPGNAGTILRTAAACGVGFVAALPGAVDLFSPKVVRAGMGAHFRLPLYQGESVLDIREALLGTTWVAADASAGKSVYGFSWPEQAALVIGSEAHGLSKEVCEVIDDRVRVPMRGGVESLNAASAAAIIMYSALGPYLP